MSETMINYSMSPEVKAGLAFTLASRAGMMTVAIPGIEKDFLVRTYQWYKRAVEFTATVEGDSEESYWLAIKAKLEEHLATLQPPTVSPRAMGQLTDELYRYVEAVVRLYYCKMGEAIEVSTAHDYEFIDRTKEAA